MAYLMAELLMSHNQWLVTLSLTCGLLAMLLVMFWLSYRTGGLPSRIVPPGKLGPLPGWRMVRRVVIAVVGFTVVLVGIALLVLPGPAFIVIPAGLAILATEFAWARRLLRRVKERAVAAGSYMGVGGGSGKDETGSEDKPAKAKPDDSTALMKQDQAPPA